MVTQDEREFWSQASSRRSGPYFDDDWPAQPGELPAESTAPTLPADMVPVSFRGWLEEVATRACFPLEFVAAPALVAAGAVVGRGVGIMPNHFDDFLVVPNLWGAVIARPGLMKSYAIGEALRPLMRLAASAREKYKQMSEEQAARRVRLQAELEALKSRMVQAAKKGTDEGSELERSYALVQREIETSTVKERRYLTHDATVESFDRLLTENPRGMLVVRDELAGWLRTFSKPGREGDREFFLEAWNGTGSFTRDRIGRGAVHIDAVTLSVLGGIQPGKLRPLIDDAVNGRPLDDGLLQRLQVLVWPDDPGAWIAPTSWARNDLRDRAYAAFVRLNEMDDLMKVASHLSHVAQRGEGGIPYLRFAPDAQELFDDWRTKLEQRVRSKELQGSPGFEAHIAKYRSLMPSLALIFHLLALSDGQEPSAVSLEAASCAADWCAFLEEHARRLYSAELSPGLEGASTLAAKIRSGALRDRETVRDIARHQWSGLANSPAVRAALNVLDRAGWVRIIEEETGGRPTEILRLHPKLRSRSDA